MSKYSLLWTVYDRTDPNTPRHANGEEGKVLTEADRRYTLDPRVGCKFSSQNWCFELLEKLWNPNTGVRACFWFFTLTKSTSGMV